jgi:hypothetical protein
MRIIQEVLGSIHALEQELDVGNPHRASEICVEIASHLARLSEPLNQSEEDYLLSRGELYRAKLDAGMKPTPAKDSLEFNDDLNIQKMRIEKVKDFIRSREKLILRVENHLRNEVMMERKGI